MFAISPIKASQIFTNTFAILETGEASIATYFDHRAITVARIFGIWPELGDFNNVKHRHTYVCDVS